MNFIAIYLSFGNTTKHGDEIMTGLVPRDDLKRLKSRMNQLMEDFGISDPEARYKPEIKRIQDCLNQLIDDFLVESPVVTGSSGGIFKPLTDVKETDDEVVVKMDLPGMGRADIDIAVTEHTLEVKAERKAENDEKTEEFHQKERAVVRFARSLALPAEVNAEEAKASLKDGVLEIHLPKVAMAARKKVQIE